MINFLFIVALIIWYIAPMVLWGVFAVVVVEFLASLCRS